MSDPGSGAEKTTEGGTPAVTTEGGGATPTPATGTEPATGDVVSRADFEKLQAQLKDTESKKAVLEKDLHKHRDAKRKATEDREAALKAAGELEPLLAARESELEQTRAKLAELTPKAEAREAWEKAEAAKIADEAKDLDDKAKKVLNALPLDEKRDFLALVRGSKPNTTPPAELPATEPVTSPGTIDFAAEHAKGRDLNELKAQYPDQWKAFVDTGGAAKPSAPSGILGMLFGGARS